MARGVWGILVVVFLSAMLLYWFVPLQDFDFSSNRDYNFSIGNSSGEIQFYPNMRFASEEISYKISENCTLGKKNDMEEAFNFMENLTVLDFYPVEKEEDVSVYCSEKAKFSNNSMFIAGEGGPVRILPLRNYSLILKGEILLLRDVDCSDPLVAIHELIHVLGFDHSENKNNIMYPVLNCKQEIGPEVPEKINAVYSVSSLADLEISDVEASLSGKYLNMNVSVKNQGFVYSEDGKIVVYSKGDKIKSYDFEGLGPGKGIIVSYQNIWVPKIKIEELEVSVESPSAELTNENNRVLLSKIKA